MQPTLHACHDENALPRPLACSASSLTPGVSIHDLAGDGNLEAAKAVSATPEDVEELANAAKGLDCDIKKSDITELKPMNRPPAGVGEVSACLLCLFAPVTGVPKPEDRTWGACKKLLDPDRLLKMITDIKPRIDRGEVPRANFVALRGYVEGKSLDEDSIRSQSEAAAGLYVWVKAVLRC